MFELLFLGFAALAGKAVHFEMRDGEQAGQQPSYRPASGYPPVQYAQSNPQPAQYDASYYGNHAMEAPVRSGPPPIVRVPLNDRNQFICIAAMDSAITGLVLFEALIDTGANNSYITHEVARRLGLDIRRFTYSNQTRTASRVDQFAGFTAPDVSVIEDPNFRYGGHVCVDNVRIGVLQNDTLDRSVLGMDFLGRLDWSKTGGDLILRERR